MTDGIGGTSQNATCRECGCVSGIIGHDYVIRHAITCSQMAGYKTHELLEMTDVPMREKMARAMTGADCGFPEPQRQAYIDNSWRVMLPEVDAALDALLDPTEGMITAMVLDHDIQGIVYARGPGVWQRGVQAAKDGK